MTRTKKKNKRSKRKRTPRAPVAFGGTRGPTKSMREMRLKNREFMIDLTSDGTASQRMAITINPGDEANFPWLSRLAQAFESYRWNRLVFIYQPAVSTATAGRIAICPDYDVHDDNSVITKAQMLTFQDSKTGPLWQTFTCACTPKNLQKRKQYFVRSSGYGSALSRQTDAVKLWFEISSAASQGIGELWCEYDITFFTPQIHSDETDTALGATTFPSVVNNQPFYDPGIGANIKLDSTTADVEVTSNQDISFYKPGRYRVSLNGTDSGGGVLAVYPPTATGLASIVTDPTWSDFVYTTMDTTIGYASTIIDVAATASKLAPGIMKWTGVGLGAGFIDKYSVLVQEMTKLV